LPKPDGNIPNIAGKILGKIVQDTITESIELQAISKQEESVRLPSNTLIAMLGAMAKNARSHSKLVNNNLSCDL
jgi:hypothetical protein